MQNELKFWKLAAVYYLLYANVVFEKRDERTICLTPYLKMTICLTSDQGPRTKNLASHMLPFSSHIVNIQVMVVIIEDCIYLCIISFFSIGVHRNSESRVYRSVCKQDHYYKELYFYLLNPIKVYKLH